MANATLSRSATTSIRGTAQADTISSLPLVGKKFENRRMLYYETGFELKQAAGLLQTWYFRTNDAFDPDSSGTGHQPIGFDQAMALWEQFVVYGAKATVRFLSNSAAAVVVGIFLNPDTTNPPTVGDLMENGYLKSTFLYGASSATSGGAAHTVKSISLNCDNVRYFGQKGRGGYLSNSVFSGTAAASPSEVAYFGVFAYCMTGAVNYSVLFDIQLSYDVYFWEPRKISQSLSAIILRHCHEEELYRGCEDAERLKAIYRLRMQLHQTNPNYSVRQFVAAVKQAGLWEPRDVYIRRRAKERELGVEKKETSATCCSVSPSLPPLKNSLYTLYPHDMSVPEDLWSSDPVEPLEQGLEHVQLFDQCSTL